MSEDQSERHVQDRHEEANLRAGRRLERARGSNPLVDPLQTIGLSPCTVQPDGTCVVAPDRIVTTGQRSAFKTSTGAEVRFFMPVLNVPFRLIFAYNPQRGGVLDNTLRQQKAFQFRFAVGTTF